MISYSSLLFFLICFTLVTVQAQDVLGDADDYVEADNLAFAANDVSTLGDGPLGSPLGGDLAEAQLEKRQRYRCVPASWSPCPSNPRKCKPPGAACCGTQYYYWPQTHNCCPNGQGACRKGMFCCTSTCCVPGGRCGANGRCSTRIQITKTRMSTRTSMSRSTSVRTTDQTITGRPSEVATDPACSVDNGDRRRAATSQHTVTMRYKEKATTVPKGPNRSDGTKRVCLDNREIMNSMCDGMKQVNNNCSTNRMELTYAPEKRGDNYKAKCGPGFCDAENLDCDTVPQGTPCNQYYQLVRDPIDTLFGKHKMKLTCDEFPFANSKEGGDPTKGTSICVPDWQQNTQGGHLSGVGKLISGDKYVVIIEGWSCNTRRPEPGKSTNCGGMTKRDIDNITAQTITGDDLWMDFNQPGENYLLLHIGSLPAGVYTYDLNLSSGSFSNVSIIDSMGEEYAAIPGFNAANGQQTITFNLTDEAPSLALMAITKDTDISMTYNATGATEKDAVKGSAASAFMRSTGWDATLTVLPAAVVFGVFVLWI
ncbi:hypothetical protein AJ79_02707 [Helicocarpus griseus UAMH5409]|uniref:Deoxyribonuclease NucA/NucB domain-containing protein n=1 Tax=Helicocarpus griseus UAMH5409 TaxID=1447875 RepID=A0A2B7Y1F8_9EURO|nr:hypothetical protein AJ79_02707 [Helicocarpus griseus UAMH5409]